LHSYISNHPNFRESLQPIEVDPDAAAIIRDMAHSTKKVNVGPMAAVAGAIAESVGRSLLRFSNQVIVENGGDIFLSSKDTRIVGVYAGPSKFSEKMALEISPEQLPCGVCTSSGTVGHSLSFGKADAVVVISKSTSLADAAATAICNMVHKREDIDRAINYAKGVGGIDGVLVIIADTFGAWGSIKFS